jgi:hypothetical protein
MVVFWVVETSSYKMDTNCIGFEVPMAASMKMVAFWVVVLCSLVEVYDVTELLPDCTVQQTRT